MRLKLLETVKYVGNKGDTVDVDGPQGVLLVKDKLAREIAVSDVAGSLELTAAQARRQLGYGEFVQDEPAPAKAGKGKPAPVAIEYEAE